MGIQTARQKRKDNEQQQIETLLVTCGFMLSGLDHMLFEVFRRITPNNKAVLQTTKANIILSYLLLVATAILSSWIVSGKDNSDSKYFWIFSITFGYIFLLYYSTWGMRYYTKAIKQAEELLKELAALMKGLLIHP